LLLARGAPRIAAESLFAAGRQKDCSGKPGFWPQGLLRNPWGQKGAHFFLNFLAVGGFTFPQNSQALGFSYFYF
jgi:hypothetical protein